MLLPLIGFLLITAVAIVTESQRWTILTMAALNISYSFVWLAITATPGLTRDATSAVPVWNATILWTLGAELGVLLTIVALTFYLFSRSRDFL